MSVAPSDLGPAREAPRRALRVAAFVLLALIASPCLYLAAQSTLEIVRETAPTAISCEALAAAGTTRRWVTLRNCSVHYDSVVLVALPGADPGRAYVPLRPLGAAPDASYNLVLFASDDAIVERTLAVAGGGASPEPHLLSGEQATGTLQTAEFLHGHDRSQILGMPGLRGTPTIFRGGHAPGGGWTWAIGYTIAGLIPLLSGLAIALHRRASPS